jgi:peptide/nickel transport system permease protein
MGRSVARDLAGLIVTLLVSSFVVFAALYVAPGNPVAFLTKGRPVSAATVAQLSAYYHLNQPFGIRYWDWLTGILHGDLGTSIIFGIPVSSLIGPRVTTTVLLVVYAWLLIVLSGVTLGVLSGIRGRMTDAVISAGTTVGLATPVFVAAIVLITVFAVDLHWFPTLGAGSGLVGRIHSLTLPAIALALGGSAYVARVSRTAVRDAETREFVETARGRGLPSGHVLTHHVLRYALIPISTVTGITIASLLVGTVIVEPAFGLSGLGSLLVQSVEDHDFPVVQAISLILVTAFVVINVAVDMLYPLLDPRITR